MPEDKTFIEKTQPKNVLQIISGGALKNLLDGYRFPLRTSLTIYWLENPLANMDVTMGELHWKSMDGLYWLDLQDEYSPNSLFYEAYWDQHTLEPEESIRLNAPFCDAYWHKPNDSKLPDEYCEKTCKIHDLRIVLMCYEGKWNGPRLFHCFCWLWDMAYPLFVGGKLVGVLYGGQVIVTQEGENWSDELNDIRSEVVWNPFDENGTNEIPDKNDQVEEILAKVNARTDIKQDKKEQLQTVIDEHKKLKGTSVKDLVRQYKQFKEFGKTLEGVLRDLFAAKANLEALETAHNLTRTSLKVLGHETVQLTFGLEELRKKYLLDVNKLRDLKKHKANDICRDIAGYFKQLNFLFAQAEMIVSDLLKPVKEDFWAYRELLFKWEDIYRLQAEHMSLEFNIYHPYESDPLRPPVYGDKMLLEQLVYNLVSNAVKYCYQGTKIELECCKLDTKKKSPHVFIIVNYGREFRCAEPWGFGKRGENVQGVEGIGMGLYNAKRVADAHKASIEYNSQKVSDFDVPLIEAYLKQSFEGKDQKLIGRLKEELEQLKQSGEYEKIVARNKFGLKMYHPVVDEMIDLIVKPTYKVTFRITIPAKGH